MDNFDFKKYLNENKVVKEEVKDRPREQWPVGNNPLKTAVFEFYHKMLFQGDNSKQDPGKIERITQDVLNTYVKDARKFFAPKDSFWNF
jgi:hypothetical protein